jgi:hypothetical protein
MPYTNATIQRKHTFVAVLLPIHADVIELPGEKMDTQLPKLEYEAR